jgi:GNAT superfamily N-acetyltransferase
MPSEDGEAARREARGRLEVIEITDAAGAVVEREWLDRAEAVHRELRPHLPPDYATKMAAVFADGGRMCIAGDGRTVLGLAVYRAYEDTFNGRKLYVDDLVTTAGRRSQGVGRILVRALEARALAHRCPRLVLDSGTQRADAHRFYFREGMTITAFNFKKDVS